MRFLSFAQASLTLVFLTGSSLVSAQCTSDVTIDNFANWASNQNTLGYYTSDDGSFTSVVASTANKRLSITPKAGGYLYTNVPCTSATLAGFTGITFPIKGPAGASFNFELQASSGGCGATGHTSYYTSVTGLTGQTQTITVPISAFAGANPAAIKAFVWSGFSGTAAWELGEIKWKCGAAGATTVSSTTAITTTRSSTSVAPITTTTRVSTTTTTTRASTSTTSTAAPGTCTNVVVDDFISQSRLTFLGYNALGYASSDDGTMTSVVVNQSTRRLALTPKGNSYFYSNMGCLNASNKGGITVRIRAPAGTTFVVELQSSATCGAGGFQPFYRSTTQLGWTFDGTDKLYNIPFSQFSGLDKSKLMAVQVSTFSTTQAVTFGPINLYCGTTAVEYVPPTVVQPTEPTMTVPITSGTATPLVIDQFANPNSNALGFWHGGDETMSLTYNNGRLTIRATDADQSWYTKVTGSCRDMRSYENMYLHIAYTGSNLFTVAMQQHNAQCSEAVAPFPETWDVVEARRYANAAGTDIYIPMSHFNINKQRVIGLALKGFQQPNTPTVLSKIELVRTTPSGWGTVKSKIPTAPLYFACTRPNSFAFAIDDGSPDLAQQVLEIIREEEVKVTFFTVGLPLTNPSTNLTNVYREMLDKGHQLALHTYTHPKLEGLATNADIDWELTQAANALQTQLGVTTGYFRPPFGNEGARSRQRIAAVLPQGKVINWSVDVEDWLWATGPTPEKQLDAFRRDVNKGGNLVVLHYLYPSTVSYLKEFIQIAKATGKQLMRVDQCMQDPNAPPL